MNKKQIKNILNTKEYNFLKDYPVSKNIIMLCIAGSYGYNLNNENSDIDIRGIYIPDKKDILLSSYIDYKNLYEDKSTDTVIFSLSHFIKHTISKKYPSTNQLELLFLDEDKYLYIHPIFNEILNNRNLFISKKIENTIKHQIYFNKNEICKLQKYSQIDDSIYQREIYKCQTNILRLILLGIDVFLFNTMHPSLNKEQSKLLLDIKNGKYCNELYPNKKYIELVQDYWNKFETTIKNSIISDEPDSNKIMDLIENINYSIVKDKYEFNFLNS